MNCLNNELIIHSIYKNNAIQDHIRLEKNTMIWHANYGIMMAQRLIEYRIIQEQLIRSKGMRKIYLNCCS